jgi:hypothetical protein
MDDDLQHAPEDIPNLIAQREHDVVMASFPELKHSIFRRLLSWFKNVVLSVLIGKPFNLQVTSYRLIKREVARAIVSMVTSPQSTLPPLIFFVTKDVVAVPARHNPRAEGKSNYTVRRVFRMARALIFDETVLLLKVIGYLGFCVSAGSFVAGLLVVIRRVMVGTSVQGWASTIIVLLVMGGLVLFCLGVIGEYLTRMINGIERRPAFVVRQEHAHGEPTSLRETAPTATTRR